MNTFIRRLGQTLPWGSVLMLAACSSTSVPTASPQAALGATTTATAAQSQPATSAIVRGVVRDSANRPVANAQLECLGDVDCTGLYGQLSAEGHEHHATRTDANGFYECRATTRPGKAASGFMMNANLRGYEVAWREVSFPDAACTAGQDGCALAVDFTLAPLVDH